MTTRITIANLEAVVARINRVTTEWDAFDADSPRAAAVEVWQRIRESAGPVFTVRCSDGRILDVDLSDETDEGVQA